MKSTKPKETDKDKQHKLSAQELQVAIDECESTMKPSWVHFSWEYAKSGNGTRSAMAAGFAEKSAHVQANRLLKDDKIKTHQLLVKKKLTHDVRIDAEWVLLNLIAHATADRTRLIGDDGQMLPVSDWPEDVRTTVTGVDLYEHYNRAGEFEGQTRKAKTTDKLKALELIGKLDAVKAFSETVKLEAGDSLVEAIRRGKERARKAT